MQWYEGFAKDDYMKGPEYGENFKSTEKLSAGSYQIKVFNEENEGKYVLAVGDVESFPANEIIKALFVVPYLKILFFGKYYLLLIPLVISIVTYLIIKNIKRSKNKH